MLINLEAFKNNVAVILFNGKTVVDFIYYDIYSMIFHKIELLFENSISTKKPQILGLFMEQNVYLPLIIASLGNLKISFVCLTTINLEKIANKINLKYILTIENSKEFLKDYKLRNTLPLNTDINLYLWENESVCESTIENDILCIMETSGSTGESKIIKITNASIESNINCLSAEFTIKNNDFIYWATPLTFDPTLIELFLALKAGACLITVTNITKFNPKQLYSTLFSNQVDKFNYKGITIMQLVPSIFLRFPESVQKEILTSQLKILAFGGENFPKSILNYNRSPHLRIYNLYGITEVSCWATIFQIQAETGDSEIPIGAALFDTEIQVRNEQMQVLTEGQGEVFIGSKIRRCIIPDEADSEFKATGDIATINKTGKIVLIGRKNRIVKRLGHRINLSKFEKDCLQFLNLKTASVWNEDSQKLYLFINLEEHDFKKQVQIIDKIRVKLLHLFPSEYYPDYLQIVNKFPVTSHGKINYNKLLSCSLSNENEFENLNEKFEHLILKYFGLEISDVVDYNFFDIGGDSVLLVQLLNELSDDYPKGLTKLLFEDKLGNCCRFLSQFKKRRKVHQFSNIDNNKQLIYNNDEESTIKLNWKYDLKACVDSSPLVFQYKGNKYVAVGSFAEIFVILDMLGMEKFKKTFSSPIETTAIQSPCGNYLFFGCFDGNLYSIELESWTIVWTFQTGDKIKSTPCFALKNAALVFGSYDKTLYCLKISNGDCIWKSSLHESISGNPKIDFGCGTIYVSTILGSCFGISETTGSIIWKYAACKPIFGSPCIIDDKIFWPDVGGTIHCVNKNFGVILNQFKAGGLIYSSLVCWKYFITFGCHDQGFYILNWADKELICDEIVKLDCEISSSPFIFELGDKIVVAFCTNNGILHIFDFINRKCLGKYKFSAQVFSSPFVIDKQIFIGCRDNFLYCLDIF